MKLFSWNVNGLRAIMAKGDLSRLIAVEKPDILCLQEVKATPEQIALPEAWGYGYQIWNSPAEKKGYSGTLILSKIQPVGQSLDFSPDLVKKFKFQDQYGDSNREGRLISLEFENFCLVNVYTPNSKGDLSRLSLREKAWDPAFKAHLGILSRRKPVLACGDFNVAHMEIDLARPKENVGKHGFTKEERQGFGELLESGFRDTFRYLHPQKEAAYTWWNYLGGARARNVGWRLDYWLMSSNSGLTLSDSRIHDQIMGSDHCPVSVTLKF